MDIIIRRVFKHGKSYTITLPKEWDVPEVLNVYTNDIYFIYSSAKGLESVFRAELVAHVRRRIARTGVKKYVYYLLTIPRKVVYRVGLKLGSQIFVLRTTVSDLPAFICVAKEDVYRKFTMNIVSRNTDLDDILS